MPPLSSQPAGFVVTPGASADRDHRTLTALERHLDALPVSRLTLATTSVNKAVRKIQDEVERLAAEIEVTPDRIAVGGRSFGGRCCSMAVAEGMPAAALVLLSYPLHPPGKPDKLRVDHFGQIEVPTLFVSGRKDPFGSPAEFESHVKAIPAPVELAWVDGPHSPKDDAGVCSIVERWFTEEAG